ncbi:MAG: lanthionine synthetase LanC family protein [Pyrinomonadaceae bacterium]
MNEAIQQRAGPRSEGDLTRQYQELLEEFATSLGEGWEVYDQQTGGLTWRYFSRTYNLLPTQGWKIHISIAAVEALRLFEDILPLLRTRRASFKLPNEVQGIAAINYGQAGATQFGKIVTVYPRTVEEAATLARELDQVCPKTRGPAVISDVTLRRGGAVSMRYGAFGGGEIVQDSVGRPSFTLRSPDGSLVKDQCTSNGGQPGCAPELPVPSLLPIQPDVMREILIGERRYLPLALVHSSALSRIALGLEINSCETVILKTVRHGVGGDLRGFDARDKLKNEYSVLVALSKFDGPAPKPLDLSDDDPSVLVIEDIDGVPLHQLPRLEQIRSLPLLAQALARLHEIGFAHRDVKLSNALLADGIVRLIDFGLAARVGSKQASLDGTSGYVPPEGPMASGVTTAGDVYALGACVAHTILGRDPVTLPTNGGRLVGLLHLAGTHHAARLVKDLMAPDPQDRPSVSAAATRLTENCDQLAQEVEQAPSAKPPRHDKRWYKRAAWESALATRLFIRRARDRGHWWRNSHFQSDFACEGINLGAAGIMLGLASIDHAFGRTSFNADINAGADWLISREPVANSCGLFTGDAGVALALAVAAKRLSRPELVAGARTRLLAAASPAQELDLFCGAAGVLWVGCLLADILNEPWPLEIVRSRAQLLLDSAQVRQQVVVWPPSQVLEASDAPYTGAAHGSAGIAMALAIWGKRLGHKGATELAEKTFRSLRANAFSQGGQTLSLKVEANPAPAPVVSWCHGTAGYLWCLLQAFGDNSALQAEIDWAAYAFVDATTNPIDNPTYCHGLSGYLELWRMLAALPRYRSLALQRASRVAATLRLLCQRLQRHSVWCSEEPKVITPDLWIGFLGPATALALHAVGGRAPLLSASWLSSCASQ